MTTSFGPCGPQARIDGVPVSPMIHDCVECILGARIDPVFGPMVLFGLKGAAEGTLFHEL